MIYLFYFYNNCHTNYNFQLVNSTKKFYTDNTLKSKLLTILSITPQFSIQNGLEITPMT